MTTVDEIEQAIQTLEAKDLAALRDWFVAFDAEIWDRQLDDRFVSSAPVGWPAWKPDA